MHDHSLLFKADIDILGTSNSIANHTIYPVAESYPWSHGETRNTMKLARSYVESEDDGKINWAANAQTMLMVSIVLKSIVQLLLMQCRLSTRTSRTLSARIVATASCPASAAACI